MTAITGPHCDPICGMREFAPQPPTAHPSDGPATTPVAGPVYMQEKQ